MREHVAVPGAALHWQRLRLKNGRSLAESGTQLGGVQQGGFPVRLRLVEAFAWGGRHAQDATDGTLQAAATADAVRARGKGE